MIGKKEGGERLVEFEGEGRFFFRGVNQATTNERFQAGGGRKTSMLKFKAR